MPALRTFVVAAAAVTAAAGSVVALESSSGSDPSETASAETVPSVAVSEPSMASGVVPPALSTTTSTTVVTTTTTSAPPAPTTTVAPTTTAAPPPAPEPVLRPAASSAPVSRPPTAAPAPPPPPPPPPPPAPAPPPPPAISAEPGSEAEMLGLINQARSANGLPALARNGGAANFARAWATQMAQDGRMRHHPNRSAGLAAYGVTSWSTTGENVGYGGSAARVHQMFMGSGGHRANILSPSFTSVGIGVVRNGGTVYVAVEFIG